MNRQLRESLRKQYGSPRRVAVQTVGIKVKCTHHPKGEHWMSATVSEDNTLLALRGACSHAAGMAAKALGAEMACVDMASVTSRAAKGCDIAWGSRYKPLPALVLNKSNVKLREVRQEQIVPATVPAWRRYLGVVASSAAGVPLVCEAESLYEGGLVLNAVARDGSVGGKPKPNEEDTNALALRRRRIA